jgi:FkbM family methyltransferase
LIGQVKTWLQSLLLGTYRAVLSTGVLSTRIGRFLYEWLYDQYKTFLEAGDVRVLSPLVGQKQTVLDVGANVGFFTRRFASWVGQGGHVIAIEPEDTNFQSLQRMVDRRQLGPIVELVQGVADERSGMVKLQLNPFHPADHKIGEQGVPVAAYALDDLLAQRNWPEVSLIKIDVQGAEERVLRGARETLRRFHPALFVEIDEQALAAMHSSPLRVFEFLADYGYEPHQIEPGRVSPALARDEALALPHAGSYTDFLFLAGASPSSGLLSGAAA